MSKKQVGLFYWDCVISYNENEVENEKRIL